jgi:hypothetical protein
VTLTHSSDIASAYGELTIDFLISHDIDDGGNILLKFPRWDANSDEDVKIISYFENNECVLIHDEETNIWDQATCALTTDNDLDIITVSNTFDQSLVYDAGNILTLKFQNVRNAASTKGIQDIQMYTTDLDSFVYE